MWWRAELVLMHVQEDSLAGLMEGVDVVDEELALDANSAAAYGH